MSYNFGIGVITRNRFEYLSKCLETIYKHHPKYEYNIDAPLIVGDDASDENIVDTMVSYYHKQSEDSNGHVLHFRKQRGMSANIKQVYDFAESYLNLDYLFFTVNDFYCTREIDFPALLQFMEDNPKVGQIQFVHWKGELNGKKRERANFNWTTEFHKPKKDRNPVEVDEWVQVGEERIRKTTYSFVNLPAITRLHACDITRGTLEAERRKGESPDKYIQRMELRWVKNWYDTGLENWEIDPDTQPFLGMDINITNRTGNIMA